MSLRRTALILVATGFASAALSSTATAGAFVGAGVGYFHSAFKNDVLVKATNERYDNIDKAGKVNGKVILGYLWKLNRYRLGLMANYTVDNDSHLHTGRTTHSTTDDFKLNYGINVLLGYQLTPKWRPYVFAGGQIGRYKHSSTNLRTGETFGSTSNLKGIQGGLGVNYQLTQHLATEINYSYTYFENNTVGGNSPIAPVIKKVRPVVQQGTIDLIYSL